MKTTVKNEIELREVTKTENINPSKARMYLERNESDDYNNRNLKEWKIEQYAKDMKSGKWEFNGETIKFSRTGRLLDGQHRLLAIIMADVTIKMEVRYGLEDKVIPTIDTGTPRQSSDVLTINGFENATKISSIVKFVLNFRSGQYDQASRAYSKGKHAITNEMVLDYVKKHKKSLYESYSYGYNKDNNIISGTYLGGLHYIFKKISESEANDFCSRVADGLALSKESPIHLLRKKLIEDANAKRKMPNNERIAFVCKAWNHFRKKSKIKRLSLDIIKEGFPKPI